MIDFKMLLAGDKRQDEWSHVEGACQRKEGGSMKRTWVGVVQSAGHMAQSS